MYMATKPLGMKMEDYKVSQEKIDDENFKYNTNQKLSSLKVLIEDAFTKIDQLFLGQLEAKQSHHLEMTQVMNDCMDSLKSFRDVIDGFEIKINKMLNNLMSFESDLANFVLIQDSEEHFSDVYLRIDGVSSKNDRAINDLKSEIGRHFSNCQNLIQEHKKEIMSIPSDVPELKNLIDKKLELVELNGQNSILRSTNNERHIYLLEKKIENIYQLLKKFDLENQG